MHKGKIPVKNGTIMEQTTAQHESEDRQIKI